MFHRSLTTLLLLLLLPMLAHGVEVPKATDLAADARLAASKQVPILLVVSQDHCSFCHLLKREILRPMLISGEYDDKVIIRELLIDEGESVVNFQGRTVEAAELAHTYRSYLTPTLLFLDHQGRERAPRIVGINTIEMYGYYVDEAIDQALASIRRTR
jgi:thioredoxin-related protein